MFKLFVVGISFAGALLQAPAQPQADSAPPKPNDYAEAKANLAMAAGLQQGRPARR